MRDLNDTQTQHLFEPLVLEPLSQRFEFVALSDEIAGLVYADFDSRR